jgi:hypothetical protein
MVSIVIIFRVDSFLSISIETNSSILQFTMSDNGWFELCIVVVIVVVVAMDVVAVMCDRNNGQRRILRRKPMLQLQLQLLPLLLRRSGRALIRWNEMNCPDCRGTSRNSGRSTSGAGPPTSRACTRTTTDDTFLRFDNKIKINNRLFFL